MTYLILLYNYAKNYYKDLVILYDSYEIKKI